MKKNHHGIPSAFPLHKLAACLVLLGVGGTAMAGEGYKLRQSPFGSFGGEIAAKADSPGFFGTAILTDVKIEEVKDGDGNNITVPGRSVPMPTGTPTKGAVPDGTYQLVVKPGTIDFNQKQTNVNLIGGYLTETEYSSGRIAFAVNVPIIKMSRTFVVTQADGTVSPTVNPAFPPALQGGIAAVGAAVNTQVKAAVAATSAAQNAEVSGLGDTELSTVWIHHKDHLKVAAGVSVYVPTGKYDKNRGPNPGFGDFYTIRPGVAVSYALNPDKTSNAWDSGVTIAGRVSYGMNTKNKETDYKSGNFIYGEAAIVKVSGDWAFGTNVLAIQQTTDDEGTGVPVDGARYKNFGYGPFVSYKLPGQDAGFNFSVMRNFGSRNALVAQGLQLRFIKAW